MRALLVGTGACLTLAAFVAAERLHSTMADAAAVEQKATVQAALDDYLAQSTATFEAETAAIRDAAETAQKRTAMLTVAIQKLTSERDSLAAEMTELQSNADSAAQQLASFDAIASGMAQKVELQQASLAEKDAELNALRTEIDSLAEAANETEELPQNDELLAEIASLSESLKARDETIASLEEAIETASNSGEIAIVPNTELEAELAAAQAKIAELTGAADEKADAVDARIAELSSAIEEKDAALALLETQLKEQKQALEANEVASAGESETTDETGDLAVQLAELTERVSEQAETIATLRMGFADESASSSEMAEACFERANKIFEISQINFATGTASISPDSMTTLEHLRDLAIGCNREDMFIEIGGHTDSYGAEGSNQKLSEARANSVKEFLIARGIPAETMVAVGFGESQPVASNDTAAGRAQNRRITFAWQMREAEPASETEPGNVDG